ncbi:unnamed protein product, partial [Symbiodinium necroappetens]
AAEEVAVQLAGNHQLSMRITTSGPNECFLVSQDGQMLWLFAVAQVGREVHGVGINRDRDVGFMLEYPEGLPTEERLAREREVLEAEERSRMPVERPVVAGWDAARRFWEEVQRPRWEARVGVNTTNGRVCFWDTRMWKLFQREMQMRTISFDQGAMGGSSKNSTTLGTNINALMSLKIDGVRVDEGDSLPERGDKDYVWTPGLVRAITVALNFWSREAKCPPRLFAMSPTQWRAHVNGSHAEYRKDCATCVMSRGVGRQHRRVHHPEAYVLTSDVAGPLSPGLDATSKGSMGKNLKYMLVAKYMVPREFITDYSGAAPENDGVVPREKEEVEPTGCDDKLDELFGLDQEEGEIAKELTVPVEIEATPEGISSDDHPDQLDEDLQEYYPSEEETEEVVQEEEDDDHKPDPAMWHGDCEPPSLTYLTFAASDEEESDAAQWEMYLDLEPGMVKVTDAHQGEVHEPMVSKAELSFTRGIEEILSGLTGPLDVTYNVSPDEVMRDLEKWRPAILY